MNSNQLHILQHSLGCYRNRYVSDPDDDLRQLVLAGLMHDHGPQKIAGGMHCFVVTIHGLKAMIDASPNPPKLTRSQLRYRRYLKVADCFESFRSFLRYENRQSKEAR